MFNPCGSEYEMGRKRPIPLRRHSNINAIPGWIQRLLLPEAFCEIAAPLQQLYFHWGRRSIEQIERPGRASKPAIAAHFSDRWPQSQQLQHFVDAAAAICLLKGLRQRIVITQKLPWEPVRKLAQSAASAPSKRLGIVERQRDLHWRATQTKTDAEASVSINRQIKPLRRPQPLPSHGQPARCKPWVRHHQRGSRSA